jgi:hypothetical protein
MSNLAHNFIISTVLSAQACGNVGLGNTCAQQNLQGGFQQVEATSLGNSISATEGLLNQGSGQSTVNFGLGNDSTQTNDQLEVQQVRAVD